VKHRELYDVLGVDPTATPEDMKKARQSAAKRLHPDRDGGDAQAMAEVNRAYHVLSDPVARERYDKVGAMSAEQTLDEKAFNMIVIGVQEQTINSPHLPLMESMKGQLETGIKSHKAEVKKAEEVVMRCNARIDKIANKEHAGSQMVVRALESLRDQRIDQQQQLEANQRVLERVIEILAGVIDETPAPVAKSSMWQAIDGMRNTQGSFR